MLKGAAALGLAALPGTARPQAGGAGSLMLVLQGIDSALSPALVRQVVATFFSRGIPVAAVVDGLDGGPADTDPPAEVHRSLGEIARQERGLFELIVGHAPVPERERYLNLRAATGLRQRLAALPVAAPTQTDEPAIVTLFDRTGGDIVDPYAYRAAGFRINIRPGAEGGAEGTRIDPFDWGLLRIEGGPSYRITDDAAGALALLGRLGGDQMLVVSLAGSAGLTPGALLGHCEDWAGRIQSAVEEGALFATRPVDYLLQGNPGASKYLGLLLDPEGAAEPGAGMAAFMQDLTGAGFAFTLLLPAPPEDPAAPPPFCLRGPAAAGAVPIPACALLPAAAAASGDDGGAEILILPPDASAPGRWTGPRADGRFQIALAEPGGLSFAARLAADPTTDRVEVVRAAQVATPFQRLALLQQFEQARRDGLAHFHSVQGYVDRILAPDPVLERFWSARRRQASDPPGAAIPGEAQAAQYLEDARLAWGFIERFSDEDTGLCVGTAQWGALKSVNRAITLWDVGSHIQGIVAAHALAIVGADEARARLGLILENLPVETLDGLRLPPPLFLSSTVRPVRAGFDSCDTGRFLIALGAAVGAGLVALEDARAAVARWDLAGAVRDGRVFDHVSGRWADATLGHCTPYTSRGYANWGIAIASAYPPMPQDATGDDRLRLLYQAAALGHFGTEPLLLEAVELGHSPQSRFLSDVLFDAQLGWFEATGTFKCVSEAPLDFAPWFIYQGFRPDRRGDAAWVISTRSSAATYRTEAFRRRAELISTKSAFLWAAAYPHAHSDRLVELVRQKARTGNVGFSSGIFASTLAPMQDYSDVNTNGIILTAIASLLRGAP